MAAPIPQHVSQQGAHARDPLWFAVIALGLTQITAWGTSYYCLGVLAGPIATDTGWSRSLVYFGFTLALLAMGLVSTWTGRTIDRHGARGVMAGGTLLVSAGLVALSQVRSESAYLAAWVFLGVGMRLCLYDAAFAAREAGGAQALIVGAHNFYVRDRRTIIAPATRHRLPAVYEWSDQVTAGGLMSFGASLAERYQRASELAEDLATAGEIDHKATEIEDIRKRLKARDVPKKTFCWHCRKPLHARSDTCPFCGEKQ